MEAPGKTIAFTLPISCHICLGKVKQPVTCSNLHVFCKTCLQIWLERSPACPTCRVPINDENPYKSILGGAEPEPPTHDQRWDLLRARVEISLRQYEDELDTQKTRNQKLQDENKSLLEKLASQVVESKSNGETSGVGDFTVLNEELREMSNAYEKAKREVSELKKTNRSLRDQNVNQLRETELLRLEVSKRSPQKFGRITVSTLQSKLEDSEKKVRQLQKALEKTDDYVNELQRKSKHCKCVGSLKSEGVPQREPVKTVEPKMSCQRNLMSSLGRDQVDRSTERHSQDGKGNSVLHRSEVQSLDSPKPPSEHAAQIAALRAASSRMQNGRPDSKTASSSSESSTSSFSLKNSPFKFASPSSTKLHFRGAVVASSDRTVTSSDRIMTSSERSRKIATSPTKRMRVTDE